MKRVRVALATLAVVGALAIPVGSRVVAARTLDHAAGTLTPAQVDRFLADADRVATLDVFPEGGTRDAGELLNRWVVLDAGPEGARGPEAPTPWHAPELFAATRCADAKAEWPACVQTAPDVDLTWMATLSSYDTWDPTTSGAWARWLAANPDTSALAAPYPNHLPFLAAARARLLQARANGDTAAALREVRALARLLWTAEGLVPAMVATSLLGVERAAYDDAVARGVDVGGFVPVAREDQDALKRYLSALVLVYLGDAPPDTLARLEAAVPRVPGRCIAVTEAMIHAGPLREAFDGRWPGELDRRDRYAALDAAATDGTCRLAHVGRAWRGETRALTLDAVALSERPADTTPDAFDAERVLAGAPWVRQAVYAQVAAMVAPNLNRYAD